MSEPRIDQRILFVKEGSAKYISHLDLMHTMERAFLRGGITIRHTAGFHPHPYVSIPLPLPLGFSSQCELMEFGLEAGCTREALPERMNQVLPAGIRVLDCYDAARPFRELASVRYALTWEFAGDLAQGAAEAFRDLTARDHFVVQKKSKKAKSGFTEVDLIPAIQKVEALQPLGDKLELTLLLQAQNPGLSPAVLLQGFQGAWPQFAPVFTAAHRLEVLDGAGKVFR